MQKYRYLCPRTTKGLVYGHFKRNRTFYQPIQILGYVGDILIGHRKQYEEDSKMLKEITSNKEALEKVAREKYLMKKENEDIFIFEEDLK